MKRMLILFLFCCVNSYSQKELWGVNSGDEYISEQPNAYFGNITRYDINGESPVIMHEFNGTEGKIPKGKLFLASNGKLYGTTLFGGSLGQLVTNAGVLYEYDLILNKYRVVKYFETDLINSNGVETNPRIGVLEPIIGQLYGATYNRIYKYDLNTQIVTFYNKLPFKNIFGYELIKASDGNLYGTSFDNICPNALSTYYENGCVVKFKISTNNLSVAHPLNCDIASEGSAPWTQLVEISPGKLIGATLNGGITQTGYTGILFEYNFNSNTFTKKIDLNGVTGGNPNTLVNGNNGKVYGLCEYGGIPPGNTSTDLSDFRGTLFEYTPTTNVFEVKQYFGINIFNSNTNFNNYVRYPTSLIKNSNGHFVGTIPNGGTYRWLSDTNTIVNQGGNSAPINGSNNANFIEICRKPSYQEFIPSTFSPCVNTPFTYNINNTNATTYVWKKDDVIVPLQTTGILNINNLIASDTGIYTCTMTNECGETTTMNLNINVNCLDVPEVIADKNSISLYPNPTKNT
ncbi:choice-of-anchor tandem repeat GloVer-containing protein, partial [Flavobacterium sp.]|uniref:immunoglobulin domain-containing protein n=1 Tax=Flavobacterium sp. TaxID=239 RepID=UPI003751072B